MVPDLFLCGDVAADTGHQQPALAWTHLDLAPGRASHGVGGRITDHIPLAKAVDDTTESIRQLCRVGRKVRDATGFSSQMLQDSPLNCRAEADGKDRGANLACERHDFFEGMRAARCGSLIVLVLSVAEHDNSLSSRYGFHVHQ